MRSVVYQAHIWLGIVIALPVLAWTTSGLLYAWPRAVEGGKIETVDRARVLVSAPEAMRRVNEYAGRELPTTALTLLMRDGRPVYQAVGGMGADSLLIDAETGAVIKTPPPGLLTRYFRQAHFYYFAGSWQVPLLVLMSLLATLSALSGIYLNVKLWRRRKAKRSNVLAGA
ncbi:MAG: PepSY domain-containing protein [Pyrinomonadaceae bacterium]|nr:PepSY domain-containing protein [Pyrinomonadaceae bacterium]